MPRISRFGARCVVLLVWCTLSALSAALTAQCPTLIGPGSTQSGECVGDVVTLTMTGGTNLQPGVQTVDWYVSQSPSFTPPAQGAYVGSAAINGTPPIPCSDPPIVLGGLINPCTAVGNTGSNPGSEENEAFFIWSGGGFNAADFGAEVNNNIQAGTQDFIGTLGGCALLAAPTVPVVGGCVIFGGPTTVVPPNAFVFVFTSALADVPLDVSAACALGFPVYVFQSSCTRGSSGNVPGALTNGTGGPYQVEFGCPGPFQSLSYFGVGGNNSSQAGWALGGFGVTAPCNGLPNFPTPPTVPVTTTIDPLDYTLQQSDCPGPLYFSAVVAPPVAGCPSSATAPIQVAINCPTATLSGSETICQNQTSNAAQITFGGTGPWTFSYEVVAPDASSTVQTNVTTTDNPYIIPVLGSQTGTYTITLLDVTAGGCTGTFSGQATVIVDAGSLASPLGTTICVDEQPFDLTALEDPTQPGGTWSGPGVLGTSFNVGNSPGSYTVTYTPPAGGGCASPGDAIITVDPTAPVQLGTPQSLCEGESLTLTNLLPSPNPLGTWSGTGVSGNLFTAPTGSGGSSILVTFTPQPGQCLEAASASINIDPGTVLQPSDVTLCESNLLESLLAYEDPAYPGGSWSGYNVVGSNLVGPHLPGTYVLTYAPPAGSPACVTAGTSTLTITAASPITFSPTTLDVCGGDLINVYSYVTAGPGPGSGATIVGPFQVGSSGDVQFPNNASGTFQYTLDQQTTGCFAPGTLTVNVTPLASALPLDATFCANTGVQSLLPFADPSVPGGTWSGPFISGTNFDVNAAGPGTYTAQYTPPTNGTTPCTSAGSMTITVEASSPLSPLSTTICELAQPYDLTQLEDPASPGGTWSGVGVSGSLFDVGANNTGTYTLTYTAAGTGSCSAAGTSTVTVEPAATVSFDPGAVCAGNSIDLTTLFSGPVVAGSFSGPGVTGTTFFSTGLASGTYTLSFSPIDPCSLPTSIPVNVTPGGTPQLASTTVCELSSSFDLTTLQDPAFPTGTWSGLGTSANTFDASLVGVGNVTLTFTPTGGGSCLQPATTTVTVSPSQTYALTPATLCESDPVLDLLTLEDSSVPNGAWAGTGVSGSFFDPTVSGAGNFVLTYTPPTTSCAAPMTTTVQVAQAAQPALDVASICPTAGTLDLTTLFTTGAVPGTWTGTGVSGNVFDPAGLANGNYSITFTPSIACALPATTTVTIQNTASPQLAAGTACVNDGLFDLTALQDPAFPLGAWSGVGVTGTTFDPSVTGVGNATVVFTPAGSGCAVAASTTVAVLTSNTPTLQTATLCFSDAPLDLSTLEDPAFPGGTWSGTGVTGGFFDPSTLSPGNYSVQYVPTQSCAATVSTTISVTTGGPAALATATTCDAAGTLDLMTLVNGSTVAGTWSGTGVTANSFDPSGLAAGDYTLTFTPSTGCLTVNTTTVTVGTTQTPNLVATSFCESSPSVLLATLEDPAFPGGTWSGPGVAGPTFDPAVAGVGTVTLTYQPVQTCASVSTTQVSITAAVQVAIQDDSVCDDGATFALATLVTSGTVAGTWSGSGVVGDDFDPAAAVLGPNAVTFTPDVGTCAQGASANITVEATLTASFDAVTLCTSSPALDLTTLPDPALSAGVWTAVVGGATLTSFDPSAAGVGTYEFLFTPNSSCQSAGTLTVEVVSAVTLTIPDPQFCESEGVIDLSTLDPAAAPGGSWSGTAVAGNMLDLTGLGGSSVALTYTPPPSSCGADPVMTSAQIVAPITLSLPLDSACVADGPVDLASLLMPTGSSGTWSGANVTAAGILTPTAGASSPTITYTPTGGCYVSPTFTYDVVEVGELTSSAPSFNCDPGDQTYTATIDVGTTANNGTITSSLGTLAGSILTIANLAVGTPTAVVISDEASCTPDVTLTLNFACGTSMCTTSAGTMSGGPFEQCADEMLSANPSSGAVDDGNDNLIYILDEDTDPLNGYVAEGLSSAFAMPPGFEGVQLFLYALAGDDDGAGSVVLSDTCLSISNALRVRWYAAGTATANPVVCDASNGTFTVSIDITDGLAPFNPVAGSSPGVFSNGGRTFTTDPLPIGTTAQVGFTSVIGCATNAITVNDNCSTGGCVIPDPGSFPSTQLTVCEGSTSEIGYNFDALLGPNDLQFFIVYADASLTTEIGRSALLPIDFAGLATAPTVVYVVSYVGLDDGTGAIDPACADVSNARAVSLVTAPQGRRDPEVCEGGRFRVGTEIFDVDRPSGTATVPNPNGGCDSVITVQLSFIPTARSTYRDTLCNGEAVTIGSITFDRNNPSGEVTLLSSTNCDSIVTVDLLFEQRARVSLTGDPDYCNPAEVSFTVEVTGTRDVSGDVRINGDDVGQVILTPGLNTLTYPAQGTFSLLLNNLTATTGGCREPNITSLSYAPTVSQVEVTIAEPLAGGYFACEGSTVDNIAADVANGVGPYRYNWSTGDTTIAINDVGLGTYSVEVTDAIGCSSTTLVEVQEADTIAYALSIDDPQCIDGLGAISISLDELPDNLRFRFDLDTLVSANSADFVFDSLEEGTYVFQLVQENGCEQAQLITLDDPRELNLIKRDTFTIELGDSVLLSADVPANMTSFQWTPPTGILCDTCSRTFASPAQDILYEAEVTTSQGCIVTDQVFVQVLPIAEIFIPTAFSPNGDGTNDVLVPLGGPEVDRINTFMVFDRWGESLWEASDFAVGDLEAGWDGTYRGRKMNPAVFVVLVEVLYRDGVTRQFTGDVALVR